MELPGRRLILLPERPGERSGYQKAVRADLAKLNFSSGDVVCCYATDPTTTAAEEPFLIIPRPSRYALSRLTNLLRGRVSGELPAEDLQRMLPQRTFAGIFCGEVTLYRALRTLFPGMPMVVRFHNFFCVGVLRNQFLNYRLPMATRLHFYLLGRLEREILRDKSVIPVFITDEEYQFFRMAYPR